MLGRRVAARQPPPTCLPELRRALLDEWCNILQDQMDNLILSMPRHCKHEDCGATCFCSFIRRDKRWETAQERRSSTKMRCLDVCLLQLVIVNVTSCLRLKYVKIPRIFPSGLDVVLTCDFDLEGETLYAIKWFHDGKEFYRYSPEEEPKTMFFPARGIKVDVGISLNISKAYDNVLKGTFYLTNAFVASRIILI
ncbi:uncharacterized protein TNCV_4152741 [Trichonephila clavipes]|nr:uncharacterized protein TNCV_4152741 [Trichonephila clavipes]